VLTDIAAADTRELRAQVCVVGGGAAGITVATELARNGVSVIVLEGGGRRFEERSQELFHSEVVGLAHTGIHTLRFRTLGGATTRWAGQALPLQDIDFTARSWVPESGWPLTPAELQPYLKRAETNLARTSVLRFVDVFTRYHVQKELANPGPICRLMRVGRLVDDRSSFFVNLFAGHSLNHRHEAI
jgi:choline dehydrogenase-like flavoprotein